MKISGIICEYNPLHNGHLYHLEQVRRAGAEGIVAVMSGNFVQRGDAALLDKFTRARLAIEGGVDLVLELPVPYALAPADAKKYLENHELIRVATKYPNIAKDYFYNTRHQTVEIIKLNGSNCILMSFIV